MDATTAFVIGLFLGSVIFISLWRSAVEGAKLDRAAIKSFEKSLREIRKREQEII